MNSSASAAKQGESMILANKKAYATSMQDGTAGSV